MAIRNEALLKQLAKETQEYEKILKEYEAAWSAYLWIGYECDKMEWQMEDACKVGALKSRL